MIDIVSPFVYYGGMTSGRYLGIDYGRRRIGVALSDPTGLIAQPLTTLTVTGIDKAAAEIARLAGDNEVVGVVVGIPTSMSGKPSETSQEVEKFMAVLKKLLDIPIHGEDERLSSHTAEQILHAHGKHIKGHKETIDRISAAIILQSFLDRERRG